MELFLNILWLLIAICVVSGWGIGRTCQRLWGPSKLRQEWIAIATALVFLFFAVSLSDDLQEAAAAAAAPLATLSEDAANGRRHGLVWGRAHSSHQNTVRPQASSAAAPSRLLFSPNLQVVERILPAVPNVDRGLKGSPLFGRAPPFNS